MGGLISSTSGSGESVGTSSVVMLRSWLPQVRTGRSLEGTSDPQDQFSLLNLKWPFWLGLGSTEACSVSLDQYPILRLHFLLIASPYRKAHMSSSVKILLCLLVETHRLRNTTSMALLNHYAARGICFPVQVRSCFG